MIDEKKMQLIIEKLRGYADGCWATACEYRESSDPEEKSIAERNLGEMSGYDYAIVIIKRMMRGEEP